MLVCIGAESIVAVSLLFTCVFWVVTGQLFGGHSTPAMGYGGVQLPPGRDYSAGRGTGGGGFSGQREGSYGGGRSDRPSIGSSRNDDRRDQRPPFRSGGGDRRHDDVNRRRDSGRDRGRSSNRMGAGAGRGPGGGSGPGPYEREDRERGRDRDRDRRDDDRKRDRSPGLRASHDRKTSPAGEREDRIRKESPRRESSYRYLACINLPCYLVVRYSEGVFVLFVICLYVQWLGCSGDVLETYPALIC